MYVFRTIYPISGGFFSPFPSMPAAVRRRFSGRRLPHTLRSSLSAGGFPPLRLRLRCGPARCGGCVTSPPPAMRVKN